MAGSRVAAYAVDTATVALSTSYSNVITLDGTDEADANDFPERVILGLAQLQMDTFVSSPTTVTWYISEDSAGDLPITPAVTTTIVGQTANTGGVAESIGVPWVVNETAGKLYIWAKLDAGTANVTKAKISFHTPSNR